MTKTEKKAIAQLRARAKASMRRLLREAKEVAPFDPDYAHAYSIAAELSLLHEFGILASPALGDSEFVQLVREERARRG